MEKKDYLRYSKKETDLVMNCQTPNEFFKKYDEEFPESNRSTVSIVSLWNHKSAIKKAALLAANEVEKPAKRDVDTKQKVFTTPIAGSEKSLEELAAERLNELRLQNETLKEIMIDTQAMAEYMHQSLENQNAMLYVMKDTYSLFANKLSKPHQEMQELKKPE